MGLFAPYRQELAPSVSMKWRFHSCRVKEDKVEELRDLIQLLFSRRSLPHLTGWSKTWQKKELLRDLCTRSGAFAQAMEEGEEAPPIPFAIAHLRVRNQFLEAIAKEVPDAPYDLIARILSEFLEPGGEIVFETAKRVEKWEITGDGAARVGR